MSLYNMCVGNNPLFGLLARVLETAAPLPQVERFRDAYTTDTHIVIYTRLGGGNRKDYVACHEALRRHPLFASDHDDDFDQTFCHHLFRIPDDFQEDDYRKNHPRFQGENFEKNLQLVREVEEMAREKGCTTAQLALAWVLAKGDDVVPIPGTKHVKYLDDNIGALEVKLSDEDLRRLDDILPPGAAAGLRYHERGMATVNL